MVRLESITSFFHTHGQLRRSQRTTLATMVWALLSSSNPLLGIAKIGHRLAMAYHDPDKKAKYAIKRVDRFVGHAGLDMEIAQGDLIRYILGDTREALIT